MESSGGMKPMPCAANWSTGRSTATVLKPRWVLYSIACFSCYGTRGFRVLISIRPAATQSGDQQQSALAVAAHLVHADRKITAEESDLLDQLTRQMTLPDNEARTIVEAIEALNRDMLDS